MVNKRVFNGFTVMSEAQSLRTKTEGNADELHLATSYDNEETYNFHDFMQIMKALDRTFETEITT